MVAAIKGHEVVQEVAAHACGSALIDLGDQDLLGRRTNRAHRENGQNTKADPPKRIAFALKEHIVEHRLDHVAEKAEH